MTETMTLSTNEEPICANCGHEKRKHSVFSGCCATDPNTGDYNCDCNQFEKAES